MQELGVSFLQLFARNQLLNADTVCGCTILHALGVVMLLMTVVAIWYRKLEQGIYGFRICLVLHETLHIIKQCSEKEWCWGTRRETNWEYVFLTASYLLISIKYVVHDNPPCYLKETYRFLMVGSNKDICQIVPFNIACGGTNQLVLKRLFEIYL